jgi:hypothetical protein
LVPTTPLYKQFRRVGSAFSLVAAPVALAIVLVLLAADRATAQADLTGLWRPLPRNEDGSGMIGDAACEAR